MDIFTKSCGDSGKFKNPLLVLILIGEMADINLIRASNFKFFNHFMSYHVILCDFISPWVTDHFSRTPLPSSQKVPVTLVISHYFIIVLCFFKFPMTPLSIPREFNFLSYMICHLVIIMYRQILCSIFMIIYNLEAILKMFIAVWRVLPSRFS